MAQYFDRSVCEQPLRNQLRRRSYLYMSASVRRVLHYGARTSPAVNHEEEVVGSREVSVLGRSFEPRRKADVWRKDDVIGTREPALCKLAHPLWSPLLACEPHS